MVHCLSKALATDHAWPGELDEVTDLIERERAKENGPVHGNVEIAGNFLRCHV
jgi:hypothetical protein